MTPRNFVTKGRKEDSLYFAVVRFMLVSRITKRDPNDQKWKERKEKYRKEIKSILYKWDLD